MLTSGPQTLFNPFLRCSIDPSVVNNAVEGVVDKLGCLGSVFLLFILLLIFNGEILLLLI